MYMGLAIIYSFRGPQYLPPQARVASVNSSSAIREVMVDHVFLNLASAEPLSLNILHS